MTDDSAAERHWFHAHGAEQRGPVPESALAALIASGEIGPDTLVWTDGMDGWRPAQASLPGMLIPQRWVDGLPRAGAGLPPMPPASARTQSAPSWDGTATYHPAGFVDAVSTVLRRYVQFSGRARRPEYWWWVLFAFGGSLLLSIVDGIFFGFSEESIAVLAPLFSLATFLPSLAVGVRRLHDIGKSGWWLLLGFIPLIGTIILIIWFVRRGDAHDNAYGPA